MPRRALPPAADRHEGLRGALLHTLPGRAIVIGVAIRLIIAILGRSVGYVPTFLRVVDTVAGLAFVAGGTYFVFRLLVLAKRRLLWRVRRKLILSYIFVGFVPALLIVAFFLLCGYLLFYHFGSYLVQSRLRALSDQARFLAQSTALEIQRAGHTPLIYVPGPGVEAQGVQILAPDGMVLGLKLDSGEMFARFLEESTIPLNPGDLYLFFTDGISEAMNARDDLFGEQRLGELVESHAHLPSEQLRERMLREIAAFVGDAPQHDDMTMILLKVDEAVSGVPAVTAELAELAE
jgi:hypothetical protein